jgi:phage shock protein E
MKQQFKWQIVPLFLALIVVLGGCGVQAAIPPAGQTVGAVSDLKLQNLPVNVDAATVEKLRQRDDVVILDVREDFEYNDGHIPGATLVPLGQIPNRLTEIPKDKMVIAVCRSGNRSGQATDFLRQQGFENVHNMTGGMKAWSQAGYQIEK